MSIWNEKAKVKVTKATRKPEKAEEDVVVVSKENERVGIGVKELRSFKDQRLDKLMPVLIEMITKLLSAGGMVRYRTGFVNKIREIMDEN